jgi:uncharacterized membrane protein
MQQKLLLALFAILLLSPAHAALKLCNRTSYVIYAATGQLAGSNIVMQGWTRIAPGSCEDAVKSDLTAQGYYLYARSSRAHSGQPRAWAGTVNLCVRDNNFAFHLPFGARCPDAGYELPFAPINTHHMRTLTATLREAPDLPSMAAAERAGLKRLLGDVGVRNIANDRQLSDALAAFKKKMRLRDGTPALFDALETEAMKSAAPVGYTLCNDSDKPFYAALGLQKNNAFVSRGWWTVAAGACSHLITDSVAGRKVWLRVERDKGAPLVAGPMTFCVTGIEFEIQGRDKCAKRGLTEAGFTETNSRGLPGVSAHVTGNGLAK